MPLSGKGMIAKIEEAKSNLDIYKRVQTGGGFTVTLQDDVDKTLEALFASRSRRKGYLATNHSRTVTTITLNTTASSILPPAPDVIYVGGETIYYTGMSGSTLTGCTRGYLGTYPQQHRGGASQGASVYSGAPPSWFGRRVTLTGYLLSDGGAIDSTTAEALGMFRMEEAPVYVGDGRWEIRCAHLSDELAQKKIGLGVKELDQLESADPVLSVATDAGEEVLEFFIPSDLSSYFQGGDIALHAVIKVDCGGVEHAGMFPFMFATDNSDGRHIVTLRQAELSPGATAIIHYVTTQRVQSGISRDLQRAGLRGTPVPEPAVVKAVKLVAFLDSQTPSSSVLLAMTSRLGLLDNGAYDGLAGADPVTLGAPGFRFGADILAAEVDIVSFENAQRTIDPSWRVIIDEEQPLTDLTEDFCRQTETAIVYSLAGQITCKRLARERGEATFEITDDNIVGDVQVRLDEEQVFSRAKVECSYNPLTGEYETIVNVADEELASTYPHSDRALTLKSKAFTVSPLPLNHNNPRAHLAVTHDTLLPALRRDMVQFKGGALLVSLSCNMSAALVALGDLVQLNTTAGIDYRGATLGGSGRVIGRAPKWDDGKIDLEIVMLDSSVVFSPSAVITSIDGVPVTSFTCTLSTTDTQNASASPTAAFAVGDVVKIYDVSTDTVLAGTYSVGTINSASQMTIQMGSEFDPVPVADDVIIMVTRGSGVQSSLGFFREDFAYQTGDDDVERYGGNTTRWS